MGARKIYERYLGTGRGASTGNTFIKLTGGAVISRKGTVIKNDVVGSAATILAAVIPIEFAPEAKIHKFVCAFNKTNSTISGAPKLKVRLLNQYPFATGAPALLIDQTTPTMFYSMMDVIEPNHPGMASFTPVNDTFFHGVSVYSTNGYAFRNMDPKDSDYKSINGGTMSSADPMGVISPQVLPGRVVYVYIATETGAAMDAINVLNFEIALCAEPATGE